MDSERVRHLAIRQLLDFAQSTVWPETCLGAIQGDSGAPTQARAEEALMHIRIHETMQVGDLIAAAYDEAARQTSDADEASRVATRVVTRFLRGARRALPPPRIPSAPSGPRTPGQGENQ